MAITTISVEDLGWCIVKLAPTQYGTPKLTIVSPADESEAGFIPAQSINVYGEVSIEKLRDFLMLYVPVRPPPKENT